jgi:AcrR family transcriptional regulator
VAESDATRTVLLEAAARLLATQGAEALTTRRLAAEVGTSTMAVYTHFGGKPELMRALYVEGFARFAIRLAEAGTTDDPLADLIRLCGAYRAFALDNPNFYNLMFGRQASSFQPSPEDGEKALKTLEVLIDAVARCVEADIFAGEPLPLAVQIWVALHGAMSLELALGDYLQLLAGGPLYDELIKTVVSGLTK